VMRIVRVYKRAMASRRHPVDLAARCSSWCQRVPPISPATLPRSSHRTGVMMQVQPYLFFEGRCEEAIELYRQALGAEVTMLMRYRDSPEPPVGCELPPGSDDKVMHAQLRIGSSEVMASDGLCSGQPNFQGVALS